MGKTILKPSLIPPSYIALALSLVLGGSLLVPTALAQQGNDPIDITAEEQEFGDDCMIARGNVRVVTGDTIIYAPIATMYKGPDGQPQTAVFTGNPRLKQGQNVINANKLTFFVKTSVIVAEGSAHSEFLTSQAAGSAKPATADGDDEDDATKTADNRPQRFITDSDRQVFEKKTGKFEAFGKVHVKTEGQVDVDSDHLRLVYGTNGKPEAVVFTGKVTAKKERNVTQSDTMTYFLTTKRMQATGQVKSKVIQERTATGPKKGGPNQGTTLQAKKPPVSGPISGDQLETANQWGTTSGSEPDAGSVTTPTIAAAAPAPTKKKEKTEFISSGSTKETQEITILSDAQDYNEETGRMDADGNVRVYMKDTIGIGPKVTMFNNELGQADHVLFTGRSQIAQPGKKWIGDRITLVIDDRRVISEGNTRAIILGSKTNGRGPSLPSMNFASSSGPKTSKKPAMTNDFDQYVY